MKKKVFSVLLTVALATGVLAGCGSSAATGNNAATGADRKSTRLNSSHNNQSRMPSSA